MFDGRVLHLCGFTRARDYIFVHLDFEGTKLELMLLELCNIVLFNGAESLDDSNGQKRL